jgi:hypothetical protein
MLLAGECLIFCKEFVLMGCVSVRVTVIDRCELPYNSSQGC